MKIVPLLDTSFVDTAPQVTSDIVVSVNGKIESSNPHLSSGEETRAYSILNK